MIWKVLIKKVKSIGMVCKYLGSQKIKKCNKELVHIDFDDLNFYPESIAHYLDYFYKNFRIDLLITN